ncbi:hypothetical protein C8Q75DRAFT_733602 [Abortiporus biennis]|nr:hypothetical protein C8Q75DRAFT_733602 [Abortiporus biennis]
MFSGHNIHTGDLPYAPPLLRAPSPSSSIGTDYGPDETSLDDSRMASDAFTRMCDAQIALTAPSEEEIKANESPLIKRPTLETERNLLFIRVMNNLRDKVEELQNDEIFEHSMQRVPQATDYQQPTSNDIDSILQSMMGGNPRTQATRSHTNTPTPSQPPMSPRSPASTGSNGFHFGAFTPEGDSGSQSSTTTTTTGRMLRSRSKSRRL